MDKYDLYLEAVGEWYTGGDPPWALRHVQPVCTVRANRENLMREIEEELDICDPLIADFRVHILANAFVDKDNAKAILKRKKEA